ncbi:MAG TPA: hypothetical protein VLU25_04780 [Acidobacteriota bacterium]|nr:hypothetical protein [Acidobacteriota bacterium]
MKADPREEQRYVQAAMTYGALGLAVLLLSLIDPGLARPERRDDVAALIVAIPVFLIFAAMVAWGNRLVAALLAFMGIRPEFAWRVGYQVREKLVMLLTLTSGLRGLVLLGNASGYRPRLIPPGLEPAEPKLSMWLGVALMCVIVWALFRAGWRPFLERRRPATRTTPGKGPEE